MAERQYWVVRDPRVRELMEIYGSRREIYAYIRRISEHGYAALLERKSWRGEVETYAYAYGVKQSVAA